MMALALPCDLIRAFELAVGTGQTHATIQAAIDAATDGDTIKVHPGTYTEAVDFKGKKIAVLAVGTPPETVIDATGIQRVSVVSFRTGETEASVLEGFTLRGGTGTTVGTVTVGGGILIDNARPTIRNCEIRNNSATKGGGIVVQGATPGGLIEGCTITENRATTTVQAGGGISVVFAASTESPVLTLKNCNFIKNTAAQASMQGGGAFFGGTNVKAKVVATGCKFNENLGGSTAAPGGEGGGVYMATILVEMDGCEIADNKATNGGGLSLFNQGENSFVKNTVIRANGTATAGGGGGIFLAVSNTTRMTLTNVEISDNTAGTAGGGAVLVNAGAPNFESCRLIGNSSTDDGGAIRLASSGVKMRCNATWFARNTATDQGGAVYVSSSAASQMTFSNCIFEENRSSTHGGAISHKNTSQRVKVFHCIFYKNTTGAGNVGGFQSDTTGNPADIQNCIFWENTPYDLNAANDGAKISYSALKIVSGTIPAVRKGIKIGEDPQWVNPGALPPDFHLKATSTLVNAGNPVVDPVDGPKADADGKERFSGDAPDLGPYEISFGPVIRPKFVRGLCRHPDSQLDGAVLNIGDPIYLLRYKFLGAYPEPGCLKGCDADDSGVVDLSDAIYILRYLFQGSGQPPKVPFPALGEDTVPDGLTCTKGKLE